MAPSDSEPLSKLIQRAAQNRPPERNATRHDGLVTASASRPQKFTCDDERLYAVKFAQNNHGDGRACFNEQVVALAGALIGAPVPPVELIAIEESLVDALLENKAAHQLDFDPVAGVHHGSRWIDGYSDRRGIEHVDENRQRFGALDVLYAWLRCESDHQWIYHNELPHEVLSVDHTTFLPGSIGWTQETLAAHVTDVESDQAFSAVGLKAADRAPALARLRAVTIAEIAAVVARPPDAWGVSSDERLALAEYLAARKDAAVAYFAVDIGP